MEEDFPTLTKEGRTIQDFQDFGAGMNQYHMRVKADEIFRLLLCILIQDANFNYGVDEEETIQKVQIDEKTYRIVYQLGFSPAKLAITISRKLEGGKDDNLKVIEFQRLDNCSVMYYHQKVKDLKS